MNLLQFFEGMTSYNSLLILSALGTAYLLGIFSMLGYRIILRQKLRKRNAQIINLNNDLEIVRTEYLEVFNHHPNEGGLLTEPASTKKAQILQEEFDSFKSDFQDSIEFYVHSIDELSNSNHQLLKRIKALKIENEHLIKTIWSDEQSYNSFKTDTQPKTFKPHNQTDPRRAEEGLSIRKTTALATQNLNHWLQTNSNNSHQDPLSKIKGISTKLENKINDLGIMSYKQLSHLDESLVDDLAIAINYYAGRIKKEDWIGQANRLSQNS